MAEKLYHLKDELRAGWVDRKLPLKRIESVADHTMGALILGLTYLPEDNPKNWQGYDKNQVLRYIMIHDLAESIAGDAAVRDAAALQAAKIREREAFRYLMMVRTYDGIANLKTYYKLWENFESNADENARIARDLDKLDDLVQLYLYQREVSIPDNIEWKEQLLSDVTTEAGKEIMKILEDYFESKPDAAVV